MPKKDPKAVSKALAAKKPKRRDPIPKEDYLKTGSTVLDLAISGKRHGGFSKGRYFWLVGDSSSGKTFLTLTCLAEASINPNFDEYRFIYDNAEDGALMDIERYFGHRLAARIEPPGGTKVAPVYSETIEDFYYHLDDAVEKGVPFVYLLDSMDSLDSKYNEAKFQEAKKAARGGTAAKGDYGDGKAKTNSNRLRRVLPKLRATGSILIVLSQTRDDIGAGIFEEQKTHAGGHALKFYATVQLWSSVGSKIKKKVRDRDVVVGVNCRVKTKKNRITGRESVVEFPIYYDTGIDDIGGMVEFLITWRFWPKRSGGMVDASGDFDCEIMRKETLIRWLEENDLREDLEQVVEAAWAELQALVAVKRKNKYE